jgi:hypothetical protein
LSCFASFFFCILVFFCGLRTPVVLCFVDAGFLAGCWALVRDSAVCDCVEDRVRRVVAVGAIADYLDLTKLDGISKEIVIID